MISSLIEISEDKIVSAAIDRKIIIWDSVYRSSLSILVLSNISAHSIAYSPDFKYLVSAGYELSCIVWNLSDLRDC